MKRFARRSTFRPIPPAPLPAIGARALVVAAAGTLLAAVAAPTARANQLDEQVQLTTAEQACLSGSYQRGVDILATLYIATRKPAYIHNQARCFEQNGQYEAAIARYAEFLRQAKELPADKRTQIEANMARLEQAVARQRSGAPGYGGAANSAPAGSPPAAAAPGNAASPPSSTGAIPGGYPGYPGYTPAVAGPTAAPGPWPGTTADLAIAPASTKAASRGNPALRIVGPIAAGLGGVFLVGAALSGLRANNLASEIADDAKRNQPYDAAKFDSGKSAATLATIGFIAAPILIGTGALLYWMGLPDKTTAASRTTSRTVSLLPGFGPGSASLHLGVIY